MQMGRQYHQSEIITSSHQTNGNVSFHTGVELYLDFQIQLDLDLQAAVLLAHLGGPVLDARLAHRHDASAARGVCAMADSSSSCSASVRCSSCCCWPGSGIVRVVCCTARFGTACPSFFGGFAASGGTRCGRCVWGRELVGLI